MPGPDSVVELDEISKLKGENEILVRGIYGLGKRVMELSRKQESKRIGNIISRGVKFLYRFIFRPKSSSRAGS